MNRYVSEQLMTVEEAQRLSMLDSSSREAKQKQAAHIWSWQTVAGALEQTVSDEQVNRVIDLLRSK